MPFAARIKKGDDMPILPDNFRLIHLELARESGHPEGDARHGYDLFLPLRQDGKIDVEVYKKHPDSCRVRRIRQDGNTVGRVRHRSGSRWVFDYDKSDDADDEAGFRLGDEHFTVGEYISVRENDGALHTFRVMSVRQP